MKHIFHTHTFPPLYLYYGHKIKCLYVQHGRKLILSLIKMLKEPKIISLLRAQRGRCQAAQSTLIAPCQLQTGGNFLHFFPSNWMSCKLQLFKLWKSLIVLPQEQYNKTSSRFELWRAHLCCLTLLVKREKLFHDLGVLFQPLFLNYIKHISSTFAKPALSRTEHITLKRL